MPFPSKNNPNLSDDFSVAIIVCITEEICCLLYFREEQYVASLRYDKLQPCLHHSYLDRKMLPLPLQL